MSYIGRQNLGGAYRQLDDISSGFDGSDTTHTMQVNSQNVTVGDVNQIILSLGGVIQKPGTDFTVSGSVLTFTTAPAANTNFFAILLGSDNGGTVTPTDGSVTPGKTSFFNGTSLSAADLGIGLHLKESDSGSSSVDAHANQLVIEHGTSGEGCGISFLAATDGFVRLAFGDSGDDNIGQIVYNNTGNSMSLITNTATAVSIDGDGHVTMPKQSAVQVHKTVTQSDVANNETITFNSTPIFDVNGDMSDANTFRAPVTGKYLITFCVSVTGLDYDATYNRVKLSTSNRNRSFGIRGVQTWTDNPNYHSFEGSLLCDMDENDTAYLLWSQAGGSSIVDIFDSTFFSVHLVC